MTITNEELASLVDWEHGLISPKIFIDEEIYQLELERLFGRTWLFLAHDSMIPNPGDFFSTYMGGDPVIIARQKDSSVKAFLNVCRHRGMKVCRAEEGNTNAFMCTYHGWTYDGSGALVSVPNFEDAYYGELDMSKWGLVGIRVESYKGLWFGNFDETAPSLADYLGDMTFYIDGWLDSTPGGLEVVPGTVKWTINGNWKIAAEQFAGDAYHAPVSHSSSLGRMIPNYAELNKRQGRQVVSRQGHGQGFSVERVLQAARFENKDLQDYLENRAVEAGKRIGEGRPIGGHFNVFPNFSGLGGAQNIRVWQPKGPNHFEIWSWTVVDKDAPAELKAAQAKGSLLTEGAAGTVEIDDGENWNLMGSVLLQGSKSRSTMWNYQMGLGHETDEDPRYPGRIGLHRFGETPQRGMYRRWLEFMTSPEWPHVSTDPRVEELVEAAKARAVTDAATQSVAVSKELQHDIEQFLGFEARLLDEWRWRDWYDLLTEDIHYWMPTRKNRLRVRGFTQEVVPGIQMAHFDEDKKSMDSRIKQMESGTHWAEDPPSRTCHMISDVRVLGSSTKGEFEEYEVRSYFLCYRNRLETEVDIWSGQRDDVLRTGGEHGFEIARRTILMDQNVILAKNLSVFF